MLLPSEGRLVQSFSRTECILDASNAVSVAHNGTVHIRGIAIPRTKELSSASTSDLVIAVLLLAVQLKLEVPPCVKFLARFWFHEDFTSSLIIRSRLSFHAATIAASHAFRAPTTVKQINGLMVYMIYAVIMLGEQSRLWLKQEAVAKMSS